MSLQDKEKWDRKHLDYPIPDRPVGLLTEYAALAPARRALDVACGMGRNARYLAAHGFTVDALDISSTAIGSLRGIEGIDAREIDFDRFTLTGSYDLIVCTYFLDRRLYGQFPDALAPHGILIIETFIYHPDNDPSTANRTFLLEEGELAAMFGSDLEIIELREYWDTDYKGARTMKGSLAARKPL